MKRYLVLTLLAVALAVGVSVSGCNRNRTAQRRPVVRPAEVMAFQTRRPSTPVVLPASAYYQPASYAQVAPSPTQPPVRPYSSPVMAESLAHREARNQSAASPFPLARPSVPTLAESIPVNSEPVILAGVPIPELEPSRIYSLHSRRGATRPMAEVMISGISQSNVLRPLIPINSPSQPLASAPLQRGWVASPVTAMMNGIPGR
ncbi:MAG: hypothetical protein LBU79_01660 [Planctomycetota bacterium]|jgi:hypothetical protein|nr:hypothetical protein [Planctomycetota bacterium]